jgi:ABC-type amino acid transport system permease subunit
LVGWLVDNTVQNLAAKDKDINFGFLWVRAGYDIEPAADPLYQRQHPFPRASSSAC